MAHGYLHELNVKTSYEQEVIRFSQVRTRLDSG